MDNRNDLDDFKLLLSSNSDMIKPYFGLMFWQLADAERTMTADEFAEQGMNLQLTEMDDEILASFMASYINIWRSAKDFNAASRFVANCLDMSADELLQSRQMYLDQFTD